MEHMKNIFAILLNFELLRILFILKDCETHSESEILKKTKIKNKVFDKDIQFLIEQKYITYTFENVDIYTPNYKILFYYEITLTGKLFLYRTFFFGAFSIVCVVFAIYCLMF